MITADTLLLENAYTSAEWDADNPVLPSRVLGYDTTLRKYKMGDGTTAWLTLEWWSDETVVNPATIDIPIDTPTPFVIDANDYAEYGDNPILELQIFRDSDTTEQVFQSITRNSATNEWIIPFDGMNTLDRYQVVVSRR